MEIPVDYELLELLEKSSTARQAHVLGSIVYNAILACFDAAMEHPESAGTYIMAAKAPVELLIYRVDESNQIAAMAARMALKKGRSVLSISSSDPILNAHFGPDLYCLVDANAEKIHWIGRFISSIRTAALAEIEGEEASTMLATVEAEALDEEETTK